MATYNKSINHYKKISHYDNTLSLESGSTINSWGIQHIKICLEEQTV